MYLKASCLLKTGLTSLNKMPFFGKSGKVLIILVRSKLFVLMLFKEYLVIKKIVNEYCYSSIFDQRKYKIIGRSIKKGQFLQDNVSTFNYQGTLSHLNIPN